MIAHADYLFSKDIPPLAWDSHMHVVDPDYPVVQDAQYIPPKHTLEDALKFEAGIGISNIVLVQPSIYGFDNSCLLDALKQLGPKRGRGVVAIDPGSPPDESVLQEWHRLGVRGARVNLQSIGKKLGPQELADTLRRHANIIRPWNWVLQLYMSLDNVPALLEVAPELGVKICLDHFACPNLQEFKGREASFNPHALTGFPELVSLIHQGDTYIKFSGAYRLSDDPEMRCVTAIAQELMSLNTTKIVFATDWPHTRFYGFDIKPFIEACLEWCPGRSGVVQRIFRRNAEVLWDVEATDY